MKISEGGGRRGALDAAVQLNDLSHFGETETVNMGHWVKNLEYDYGGSGEEKANRRIANVR